VGPRPTRRRRPFDSACFGDDSFLMPHAWLKGTRAIRILDTGQGGLQGGREGEAAR